MKNTRCWIICVGLTSGLCRPAWESKRIAKRDGDIIYDSYDAAKLECDKLNVDRLKL